MYETGVIDDLVSLSRVDLVLNTASARWIYHNTSLNFDPEESVSTAALLTRLLSSHRGHRPVHQYVRNLTISMRLSEGRATRQRMKGNILKALTTVVPLLLNLVSFV